MRIVSNDFEDTSSDDLSRALHQSSLLKSTLTDNNLKGASRFNSKKTKFSSRTLLNDRVGSSQMSSVSVDTNAQSPKREKPPLSPNNPISTALKSLK